MLHREQNNIVDNHAKLHGISPFYVKILINYII